MKANFETGLKICSKCRRELPLSSFGKDIHQPDGLEYSCKECSLKRRRDYLKTKRTKEEIFQTRANLEKGTKICSKCRREFSLDHFHKCKNSYDGFGGQCIFCERAQKEIKSDHTLSLLGCSIEEFRKHIESQFQEGMTWENQGRNGWELDHIIPCSYFDLSDPEQQRICFNYRNLQPLWKLENRRKQAKVPDNVEELVGLLKQEIERE
jgi:hypothetical protein